MGKRLTEEEVQYLRDNAKVMSISELAESFNTKFGDEERCINEDGIRQHCTNRGIATFSNYRKNKNEENDFLMSIQGKLTIKEMTDKLNERFGSKERCFTTAVVRRRCDIHRIPYIRVHEGHKAHTGQKLAAKKVEKEIIAEGEPRKWTRDTAFMVVDWVTKREMPAVMIAKELHSTEGEVNKFIERLKTSGDWEKIIKIKNKDVGAQALSHTYDRSALSDRTTSRQGGLLHNL